MSDFACQEITTWEDFKSSVLAKGDGLSRWVYRGETGDRPLTTTIERALIRWNISLKHAISIEFQTIREFRRRLGQPEYERVQDDTLHCLALMQHHGAPTRLLDCTYSPFVAAAFAMENGIFPLQKNGKPPQPVVWCFNARWCERETKRNLPSNMRKVMTRRANDAQRNEKTFGPLFQLKSSLKTSSPTWKFVRSENPLHLNQRLSAQQGAFLCPANLSFSFEDNLKSMNDWQSKDSIRKLRLKLSQDEAKQFAQNLKDMNVSFAALFPGLDGFGKSIVQQIGYYHKLAQDRAGLR